jgi:L-asparaginase
VKGVEGAAELPVLWLALGGTIQARGHHTLDIDRYWQTGRSLTPDELLEPVRTMVGSVVTESVDTRPSHDLTPQAVLELCGRLRGLDPEKVRSVVVSVGSNGLEEIAFLLWLFGASVPVVATASMRPPTAIGSDALRNLVDAIAVGRAVEAREHGVVVVSDGAVLHPAEVFKCHSSRVDSFRIAGSPLGSVAGGRPRFERGPRPGPLRGAAMPARLAPVEMVTSYLGADGESVRAAVDRGVAGIVSAGMGSGFPTSAERDALLAAVRQGVVVCQAQRTPFGSVTSASEPFVCARTLTAQKARLLLSVTLAGMEPPGPLQALVDRIVDHYPEDGRNSAHASTGGAGW